MVSDGSFSVSLTPESAEIGVGDPLQLTGVITEEGLAGASYLEEWSSSMPGVATVDDAGLVRGVAAGVTEVSYSVSLGEEDEQVTDVATARVEVRDGDAPLTLTTGLFALKGLSELEAVSRLSACDGGAPDAFGPHSGGCLATLAGAEGTQIVDLATQTPLATIAPNLGPLFGAIGLTTTPAGPVADHSVFFFGQGGYGFSDGKGAYITPNRTVYDAFPAGGDAASGWATMVEPNTGFRFIGPTDEPPGFAVEPGFVQRSLVAGEPVSAWMRASGAAVLLTRDVTSRLYPYDGSALDTPLDLGLDARRVRCAETGGGGGLLAGGDLLCGVSLFGEDEIALVRWSGQGTPALVGTAQAGDGPVGIDVRALSDGTFAIASTGFSDNTVTEHKVSAAGAVVQTETRAVPAGCGQPGHVIYVGSPGAAQLVGTCFGGGGYYIADSEL